MTDLLSEHLANQTIHKVISFSLEQNDFQIKLLGSNLYWMCCVCVCVCVSDSNGNYVWCKPLINGQLLYWYLLRKNTISKEIKTLDYISTIIIIITTLNRSVETWLTGLTIIQLNFFRKLLTILSTNWQTYFETEKCDTCKKIYGRFQINQSFWLWCREYSLENE